ncbi:MAG TPA: glucodextranase DOMON-like domain-containing protein [Stenomitos sp.]
MRLIPLAVALALVLPFAAPTPAATPRQPLYVSLVWHQHQPLYPKEPGTNVYQMPWVRLHALKDYVDMAAMVERYPGLHLTFNLTPVLLQQLEDYRHGATDRYLMLAYRSADHLTPDEQRAIDQRFFQASEETFRRLPAYRALRDKPRSRYTAQDWRDLQVWFSLAWMDPDDLARPPFSGAVRKARGFTEAEKNELLRRQREIVAEVIPLHRRLQDEGKIEVATTPYFHPILPLIQDTNLASEAMPGTPLPERFSYPADAAKQVAWAVDTYRRLFGRAPRGMWPAEGSVAQAVAPHFKQAGIRWIASDEGVLAQSLKVKLRSQDRVVRPDLLYRPYQIADGPAIVFRDRKLSDDIGFVYGRMDGRQAARDLLKQLKAIAVQRSMTQPKLVSIVLDGENAWEHYPDDGKAFLDELYRGLTTSDWVKTVTPSEYLDHFKPEPLSHLWAGSWIRSDFSTWIGETEENRAWEWLLGARRALAAYGREHGEDSRYQQAERAILAAEGSDWFWWYGTDQDSGRDADFDAAYRALLVDVYRSLGLRTPGALGGEIRSDEPAPDHPPRGYVRPVLDGQIERAWDEGGLATPQGSVMQAGAAGLAELRYGWDPEALSLALTFEREPEPMRLRLHSDRRDWVLVVDPVAGSARLLGPDDAPSLPVRLATSGKVVELSVPWRHLSGMGPELTFQAEAGARLFPTNPVRVPRPLPHGTLMVAVPDPAGDALGSGRLVPPRSPRMPVDCYDLRQLEVAEAGDDWLFTVYLGRVENPWQAPNGMGLASLDLYLSRQAEAATPSALFPARGALGDRPWDVGMRLEGWLSGLYLPNGRKLADLHPQVDVLGRKVAVPVPKRLLPGTPETWRYLLFSMAQDGYSAGRIRPLMPQPALFYFAGQGAPILDWLGGDGDQERVLARTTPVLPFIAPEQPAIRPLVDRF